MWVLYSDSIQAAQKGSDARPQLKRGARNEAYSLPYAAVKLTKYMTFSIIRKLLDNLAGC